MNLKELKFKTRKHWLWINLAITPICVALLIILENMGFNKLWAFVVFIPIFMLGVNPSMVITRNEIKQVVAFIMSLVYIFMIWAAYDNNHSIKEIFSLKTLESLAYVTAFFGVLGFFFGYLPAKLLGWKDKKTISTAVYNAIEAAYYIFRKLPDEIAKKTSDNEIRDILNMHFDLMFGQAGTVNVVEQRGDEEDVKKKILEKYNHFTISDLESIFKLEEEYMESIGINIEKPLRRKK